MANNTPTVNYTISGTVLEVGEVQHIKAFRKRDFVINDQFNNPIALEAIFETADSLDGFAVGTPVDVEFNVECNKGTLKTGVQRWFTSLRAQRVSLAAQAGAGAAAPAAQTAAPQPPTQDNVPF